MTEQQNIDKANKLMERLEDLRKQYEYFTTDKRYQDYQTILRVLEDGKMVDAKLKFVRMKQTEYTNELINLRQVSQAVNTKLMELEQGIPVTQRRSDQQLIEGHYQQEQPEPAPREQPKVQPQQPKNQPQKPTPRLEEDIEIDVEGLPEVDDEEYA